MVSVKKADRRTRSVFTASAVVATAATSLALLSTAPASASPGSYDLSACSSKPQGSLHGTLRINNQDTARAHSYTAKVAWNKGSDRIGSTEVRTGMIQPGQSQDIDASTSGTAAAGEIPAGPVSCTVESLRDDNGEEVTS